MKHKILYPYLYILLIFITISVGIYKYPFYLNKKFDLAELKTLSNFISTYISEDLQQIENKYNHPSVDRKLSNFNKDIISSDLQEIGEKLDKFIPTYIDYKIILNDNILCLSKNREVKDLVRSSYQINDNNTLIIDLGININSNHHLEKIKNIYQNLHIINFILFGLFTLIIVGYAFYQKKHVIYIDYLNKKIDQLECLNEKLLANKKAHQKIERLFIKNFNKTQIFKNLDSYNSENLVNNIFSGEALPFCLIDNINSTIEVEELFKDLQDYFSIDVKNIILNFESKTPEIQIPCAKAAFYQIIFSLLCNVIIFMKEQTDAKKVLNLEINPQKLIISYHSISLNRDNMILLSDQIFNNHEKTFILNCRSVFRSITHNNLKCDVNTNTKENLNEISLFLSKETQLEKAQVINFSKK